MKMKKIGITTNFNFDTKQNFERYRYSLVSTCPIQAVADAGGIPFTIPIYTCSDTQLTEQVQTFDGLILTGGQDVNPKLWGDEPRQALGQMNGERDRFELRLLKIATELQKPILAICRGAQILNVFFGGTLYQDIVTEADAKLAHVQKAAFDEVTHKVQIDSASTTHSIFGDEIWVNSFHHMAVKTLAKPFTCTGRSSDGIIEMYESFTGAFMLGIQWHPEMLHATEPKMKALFELFLAHCN